MPVSSTRRGRVKPLVGLVVGLVILPAVLYAYVSPYVALLGLKKAVDTRDAQTISRYVDYPALRVSLKQQLTDELMRRVDPQRHNNPLAMLGAMIGSALVGPLVDAYATPEGVAALLSGLPPRGDPGEHPPTLDQAAPAPASSAVPAPSAAPPASSAAPSSGTSVANAAPSTSAAYQGVNEFVVVYQRDVGDARYAAIFRRSGLFGWKLSAIDLHR